MNEAMRELYQETILGHNRSPKNRREMETPNQQEGFNPLCGDRLTVYVKLDGDRIADVSFVGQGCAIDTASASLMTEIVKGHTRTETQEIVDAFHRLVVREPARPGDKDRLGKLAVFAGVGEYPARVKCATLPWHTLQAALRGGGDVVSTE